MVQFGLLVQYKKVLLRERKRHTDCGVSSTPSVMWGGTPPGRGTPAARSDGGYLRLGTPWLGYPPPVDRYMDGQTRVKTLPSRRTTYAVGNNVGLCFGLLHLVPILRYNSVFCSSLDIFNKLWNFICNKLLLRTSKYIVESYHCPTPRQTQILIN